MMLLFHQQNLHNISSGINDVLKCLRMWCILNSLQINVNKTKGIIFSLPQVNFLLADTLVLDNSAIEIAETVKTLGVYFHKNLSWDTHFNHLVAGISKTVGVLAKSQFLLPSCVKLQLYHALFSSQVNYSFLPWNTMT